MPLVITSSSSIKATSVWRHQLGKNILVLTTMLYTLLATQRTASAFLANTLPKQTTTPSSPLKKSITHCFSTMPSSSSQTTLSSTTPLPEMTEAQRYLFDLNGYIIIRNVLTPDDIQNANDAINRHQSAMKQRSDAPLRNAVPNTALYGSGPPRLDLGGVLEWGREDSRVFKSILAHSKLVPLFHGLLGKGYRMDHAPFVIAGNKGAEGFQLHGGTIDCVTGGYNHHLAYTCVNGVPRCSLLGCNVMLVDHKAGYGGFCVVPGSHKSHFKMPDGMVDGDAYKEFIIQPETKAGDVVLFSEGTVHGALPWQADTQRRCCLYRFAPATQAYGRSYLDDSSGDGRSWPKKYYDDLTDAQRSVLEPPYANRLDRPNINEDGESVTITTRSTAKKEHDRAVFGTKYF